MNDQLDAVIRKVPPSDTFIDHILDESGESWYGYWLSFLNTRLPYQAALVLISDQCHEALQPVALTPEKSPYAHELYGAARECQANKHAILAPRGKSQSVAACPVIHNGELLAVVAVLIPLSDKRTMAGLLSQLEFCCGWLELRFLRDRNQNMESRFTRQNHVLDGFCVIYEQDRFQAASLALCDYLCRLFQCDRVALGYSHQGAVRMACQSDSDEYVERMGVTQLTIKAMQEAYDQLETVCWPTREDRDQVSLANKAASDFSNQAAVMTVPLMDKEFCYGILLFERSQQHPFVSDDIVEVEAMSGLLGLALEQKRQAQQPVFALLAHGIRSQLETFLMPGYLTRKVILISLFVLVLFFSFAKGIYKLGADAVLEGAEVRAVVVPFDGYLERAPVRAGDRIDEGTVLAALDTQSLRLERLKWLSEKGQSQRQYEDALARQDRAQVQVLNAQMQRAAAELSLIEFQLKQAEMKAPFDAIVVSGDLSQQIGSSQRQGDTLFELAPNNRYRLAVYVDEFRINDVKPAQMGELVLAALPDQTFEFTISQITYVAEPRDGATVYRVEADLLSDVSLLRPGLEGVAKIHIDERRLISIWTRSMMDWLKLQWWRVWG